MDGSAAGTIAASDPNVNEGTSYMTSITSIAPAPSSAVPATRLEPAGPIAVESLPLRAGASVGIRLNGWAVPAVGALAGGLLFGVPGAVAGGVLGYLLIRR